MQLDLALIRLKQVASEKIEAKHYERRASLAKEYFDYYTGNLNERLQRIISRESEDEFAQRTNLTNHVTKAILNSAKLPFSKAARKQPLVRKIDFSTEKAEAKAKDIMDFMGAYNGERSLDQYLEQMVVEYNFIDPNAFLITEFLPNSELEKVKPYPFVACSKIVVDYEYSNGVIDYLILRLPIKFLEKEIVRDGFKYTMYNGNETFVLEQVGKDFVNVDSLELFDTEKESYTIAIFQVRAETDPELKPAAVQFGYILDPETGFETYLSILDCALPYLRKTLKVNSELDQSMSMTAFPQRFRYVPSCQNSGCYKGKLPDGNDCQACGGSGKAVVHKGTQDILDLDLPKNKDEMLDLNGLLIYKMPPIELLKFQDEYIRSLKTDIHTTIFNSDVFTKPTVSTTATEKILDVDNMNDTLFSFCRRYSQIWQYCVYYIAVFTDNVKKIETGADIIIQHKFPNDLKLKNLSELMADLKAAYESKASVSTISAIEDDINEILYSDRPDELKKIKVQQMFNPFKGYSPDDIRYFFSSSLTTKFNQLLYSNYANIWLELEKEEVPWIYDLEANKIWEKVKGKVEAIQKAIDDEKPNAVTLDLTTQQ